MALQPWRKGIVTHIESINELVRRYWVQVPELAVFDFIPGQFVTLDLPISDKANKRLRSYSIASSPDGSNVFELCIETNKTGVGAMYIFNEINKGSEIIFRGPAGVFTLPEKLENDTYFICEGTGIVPFRSMFNYIKTQSISHRKIYLIYGGASKADLLYHEELCDLENEIESFHYLPVVLNGKDDSCKQGTVHDIYSELILQKNDKSKEVLSEAKFYVCGWRDMADTAKENIINLGYTKKDIVQELYG